MNGRFLMQHSQKPKEIIQAQLCHALIVSFCIMKHNALQSIFLLTINDKINAFGYTN